MLFGGDGFREEVLERVRHFCLEKRITPIYGAVVGGISKGLQYCDSDYDTRFLYLSEEGVDRILLPDKLKEKDIVTRYYPEDETVYEWIPFWELTSFLHFLVNPCIDGRVSSGLYNIVGWTLGSPYNWDPYGLQAKLMPLINRIFTPAYLLDYHLSQLSTYFYEGESVIAKDYIYAVYSGLCMNWIMETNQTPPPYTETMIAILDDVELKKLIRLLISESRSNAREYLGQPNGNKSNGVLILHTAHYHVCTVHNAKIDEFIELMTDRARCRLEQYEIDDREYAIRNSVVNEMYQIIKSSMEEEKVKNIS